MVDFSGTCWVVLTALSLGAVLVMFGRLAALVEDAKREHDTAVAAERLRRRYAEELASEQEKGKVEVIEVDEAPAEPEAAAA